MFPAGYAKPYIMAGSIRALFRSGLMPHASGSHRLCRRIRLACCLCASLLLLDGGLVRAEDSRDIDDQLAGVIAGNPRQLIDDAEAQLRAPKLPPPDQQLRAWRDIALSAMELGDNTRVKKAVKEGETLANRLGNLAAVCVFQAVQANIDFSETLSPDSLQAFDRVLSFADKQQLPRCRAYAYWLKGAALATLDHTGDGLDLLLKAHDLYETMHDRIAVATMLSEIMSTYRMEGRDSHAIGKAEEYASQALALIDEKRYPNLASTIHHDLAKIYVEVEEWGKARPHIQTALTLSQDLHDRQGVAFSQRLLARLELAERHYRAALDAADRALPVFIDDQLPDLEMVTRLVRGGALAGLHQEREALAEIDRCRPLVERLGSPKYRILFHKMAGAVYAQLRDYGSAYSEAIQLYEAQLKYAHDVNMSKASELQARFDIQQRETENRLLRAEKRAEEAQRTVLWLALGLSTILLVSMAGYLVAQQRQKRRIAVLAAKDDLTGLPNRRSIMEFARSALKKPRAEGTSFCVALIDIDHFKRINDTYGHQVGDDALIMFAKACRAKLRGDDRLGRFGGEEFLLIMPSVKPAELPQVFERLRTGLRAESDVQFPQIGALTFSMGYAFVRDDSDLDAAILRADKALYEAKRRGRDRWHPEMTAA
jgi:diguanylate cyclase (GGDEF)-like protein